MAKRKTPIQTATDKLTVSAAAPPNPFYTRRYKLSLVVGEASIEIAAPGGKVAPSDAEDIIELFGLIERQLMRDIQKGRKDEVVPNVGNRAADVGGVTGEPSVEASQVLVDGMAIGADAAVP